MKKENYLGAIENTELLDKKLNEIITPQHNNPLTNIYSRSTELVDTIEKHFNKKETTIKMPIIPLPPSIFLLQPQVGFPWSLQWCTVE